MFSVCVKEEAMHTVNVRLGHISHISLQT